MTSDGWRFYRVEYQARSDRGVCPQCDVGIFAGQRYVQISDIFRNPLGKVVRRKNVRERHISCRPFDTELARSVKYEKR